MTSSKPIGEGSARYGELRGRVAIVTGAAMGIGEGIARRLAGEGMQVVLADINGDALGKTSRGFEQAGLAVMAHTGDLSLIPDIDALFDATLDAFGTLDLLVNNAADLKRRTALDRHDDLLDLQLATNVRGPYLCAQRAGEIMAERTGGSIVNISSVGAVQAHHRGLPYDMTKGAVNAMTRAMAVDLGQFGVRVNAIGPGVTLTHRSTSWIDGDVDGRIPMRRVGTADDIASMVAFLASDESSYVTGQTIYVDGGISAQLSPPGQPL